MEKTTIKSNIKIDISETIKLNEEDDEKSLIAKENNLANKYCDM